MLNRYRTNRAVLLFLLCLVTNVAHAISIKSTRSVYESDGIRYYFTVTNWGLNGVKVCDDMTATTCNLRIAGAQSPGDPAYMVDSKYFWPVKPSASMSEVLRQMKGFSIPFEGSLFVPKYTTVSNRFCITFAQGYSYPGMGGMVVPVGPCAPVIKPVLKCEVAGDTTINHRNVSDAAIDGNEAGATLQLTCTGTTKVIVSAGRESFAGINLRADGSLYSKLTIGDKSAAIGVSVNVNDGLPTPVTIKSTLYTKGTVEPGAFSGSTVVTISPP